MELYNIEAFSHLVGQQRPAAQAILRGSDSFPNIRGVVRFYTADQGSLMTAEVVGLPHDGGPFYAFHLHEGEHCGSGAGPEPFPESGGHFNPTGQSHPHHAGDFPSLLGDAGYAYISFYTGRLTPQQAVGHTVVIHQHAEDFHSQPSGNPGGKIACGPVARA